MISKELESFRKQAEVENIKFKFPTFTEEEINNFVKGYIMYLASNGSSELIAFLQNPTTDKDVVKILINDNPFNFSALMTSSENGHKEIIELLIKAGANLNTATNTGITALFMAAQNGHKEIVELLIKAGADLNTPQKDGVTALYMASQDGHKEIVELLVKAGADLNLTNNQGITVLNIAVSNGHKEIVELLVKAGADVNASLNTGETALYMASQNGHKEIVELLTKAGADLNIATDDGATALYMASQNGHKEIVELLTKAGADFNIAMKIGARPIEASICTDNDAAAKVLFNAHMSAEENTKAFISKTTENIKKFCPSELGDFQALVANYELEHAQTEL